METLTTNNSELNKELEQLTVKGTDEMGKTMEMKARAEKAESELKRLKESHKALKAKNEALERKLNPNSPSSMPGSLEDLASPSSVASSSRRRSSLGSNIGGDSGYSKALEQRLNQLVGVHRQLLRKYVSLELAASEHRKMLALRDERLKELEESAKSQTFVARAQTERHEIQIEELRIANLEEVKRAEEGGDALARRAREGRQQQEPPCTLQLSIKQGGKATSEAVVG